MTDANVTTATTPAAGPNGSVTVRRQTKTYGPRPIEYYGERCTITATVRWDDECGNGRNSFAITAVIRPADRRCRERACGCLHDEVARAFPELAPYLKWHLCGADGPMYYLENTTFLAGDRDCWGFHRGEQKRGKDGLPLWVLPVEAVCPPQVASGTEPPPDRTIRYVPLLAEGKARELEAARRSAVWPDATDEELTMPGLEARLVARLPGLVAEMRRDVEALGFTW